ncbi:hypothetical protein QYE76_037878 [Lolium multiflorum]|uniref:Reverse transcriptase domain-containing protein n=1 Tax=Lolium multiflorum TaxID=4521 RepID=A0AAD8T6E4_LOLMU|nr:hypothetical protein QYE76_037878 [Lolium multiflorum]
MINTLGLIELPLRDRQFTWSNKRATPTLIRLDRVFINHAWNVRYPSSSLSSIARDTSDHVPLVAKISTVVPRGGLFRRRRNSIPSLVVDGVDTSDHLGKAAILQAFFSDLLGSVSPTAWRFDLSSLYPNEPPLAGSLSAPFTIDEVKKAVLSMNKNSSPGPDGFGPAFFSTFWDAVSQDFRDMFSSFYDGTIDLTRINRAFLVLLPKIDAAEAIHSLVDADQTGFLSGRRISENIVYAADLLRCCHSRKAPTIVFKIDFRKAFDSVNWSSLLAILKARGFDDRWCLWMKRILDTGHTAILLNGAPGAWIRCRNGLRQGDPLSPYLFIIVADVLQRLIAHASSSASLLHPLSPGTPCPVLQYADDTLILCKATQDAASRLKQVLDDFASATGRDLGELSASPSFLEKIVADCLPLYRAITRATVVDGRSTSFWLDKWLVGEPLATCFPALFSHSTRQHATVATVVAQGLDLQPRLSAVAAAELATIRRFIDCTRLGVGHDGRAIDSPSAPRFCSREAYRALSPVRPLDTSACVAGSELYSLLHRLLHIHDDCELPLSDRPLLLCQRLQLLDTRRLNDRMRLGHLPAHADHRVQFTSSTSMPSRHLRAGHVLLCHDDAQLIQPPTNLQPPRNPTLHYRHEAAGLPECLIACS